MKKVAEKEDKEKRKREKKERKDVKKRDRGSMSAEELLRLDEVRFLVFFFFQGHIRIRKFLCVSYILKFKSFMLSQHLFQ